MESLLFNVTIIIAVLALVVAGVSYWRHKSKDTKARQTRNSARLVGLCITLVIGLLAALKVLSSDTMTLIIPAMIVFVSMLHYVNELKNTDTDQQTQIDDLKRELEEMKGKLKG